MKNGRWNFKWKKWHIRYKKADPYHTPPTKKIMCQLLEQMCDRMEPNRGISPSGVQNTKNGTKMVDQAIMVAFINQYLKLDPNVHWWRELNEKYNMINKQADDNGRINEH